MPSKIEVITPSLQSNAEKCKGATLCIDNLSNTIRQVYCSTVHWHLIPAPASLWQGLGCPCPLSRRCNEIPALLERSQSETLRQKCQNSTFAFAPCCISPRSWRSVFKSQVNNVHCSLNNLYFQEFSQMISILKRSSLSPSVIDFVLPASRINHCM